MIHHVAYKIRAAEGQFHGVCHTNMSKSHRDQRKRKCCKERVEPQLGGTRLVFVPPTGLVKRVISIIVCISAIINSYNIIDIISAERKQEHLKQSIRDLTRYNLAVQLNYLYQEALQPMQQYSHSLRICDYDKGQRHDRQHYCSHDHLHQKKERKISKS